MIKSIPINKEDFELLVEKAMRAEGYSQMRSTIEKELLHYDLLFVLDKYGLLDKLTFQGGTSLRLCYGASRLSEDLDFVGGGDFTTAHLVDMKDCIEDYIGRRYGLDITVKEPSALTREPAYKDLRVDKWQISIVTYPKRKDLPKQKIKIEVCNVPSYTSSPRALKVNYDFLPDGYDDILIFTENLEEIMADKLISLINTTRYVRHRDIWDLRWLAQQGATINSRFVLAKIEDYKIINYLSKLDVMIGRIDEVIKGKDFYDEISRFIPLHVLERTLKKEKFKEFLSNEIKGLLSQLSASLKSIII